MATPSRKKKKDREEAHAVKHTLHFEGKKVRSKHCTKFKVSSVSNAMTHMTYVLQQNGLL